MRENVDSCSAEEGEAAMYESYTAKYMRVIHHTLYSETFLRFTRHLIDKVMLVSYV